MKRRYLILISFLLTLCTLSGQNLQEGSFHISPKGDTLVVVKYSDLKKSLRKMTENENKTEEIESLLAILKEKDLKIRISDERIKVKDSVNSLLRHKTSIMDEELLLRDKEISRLNRSKFLQLFLGAGLGNFETQYYPYFSVGLNFRDKYLVTLNPGLYKNQFVYGGGFLFKIF